MPEEQCKHSQEHHCHNCDDQNYDRNIFFGCSRSFICDNPVAL